jgi:hypothetical protein
MNYKDIELTVAGKKRKFRINKFDARTGSYILYTVMSRFLPSILQLKSDAETITDMSKVVNPEDIVSSIAMSEDEFSKLQTAALQVCEEILPAGATPVVDASGNFSVIGLEKEAVAVFVLTAQALVFNLSGFFGEDGLTSLLSGIQQVTPSQNR